MMTTVALYSYVLVASKPVWRDCATTPVISFAAAQAHLMAGSRHCLCRLAAGQSGPTSYLPCGPWAGEPITECTTEVAGLPRLPQVVRKRRAPKFCSVKLAP